MFLTKIDILSPRITFYQNGKLSHSSSLSGILTLISLMLCLVVGIILSNDIIYKKNPTSHYFKKYEKDLDLFSFNSSGIFHFFRFSKNYETYPIINTSLIKFIGIRNISLYLSNRTILNEGKIEYWIYDKCQNGIDNKNFEKEIFSDVEDFNNYVCLKYYYNPETKEFSDNTNLNFKYPYLIHGSSNKNNLFYYITIETCRNNSHYNILYGNNTCGTNEEINIFKSKMDGGDLFFIDNYIDVSNYKKPINKYIQSTSATMNSLEIPVIHLMFNPSKVITHSNLFTDSFTEIQSFQYNTKEPKNRDSDNYSIADFAFWIGNNFEMYDRSYKKIQNVLADIGGIIKFIILFAQLTNYPYNQYITLKDSSNFLYKHSKKKNIILSTSINNGSNFESILQQSKIKNSILNNNYVSPSKNKINKTNSPKSNNMFLDINNEENSKRNKKILFNLNKKQLPEIKNLTMIDIHKKLNFKFYIKSICHNNKENEPLYLINKFREKLLSEEHLYLNHLRQILLSNQIKHKNKRKVNCDLSELYSKL